MSLTSKQAWLKTIRWLRKEFPALFPIIVRSRVFKSLFGDARLAYKGDTPFRFLIRINKKKNFDAKIDTLLHEWAHCLTWLGDGQDEDHSPEWGISHARIYRRFLEWDFGRKKK